MKQSASGWRFSELETINHLGVIIILNVTPINIRKYNTESCTHTKWMDPEVKLDYGKTLLVHVLIFSTVFWFGICAFKLVSCYWENPEKDIENGS